MDAFELEVSLIVLDGAQLISETIQLENMIFSSQPFRDEKNYISDLSELSDWALRFCEMKVDKVVIEAAIADSKIP